MPTTTVRCSLADCREPASYKIAAPWSDGSFSELKTYGFACSNHLGYIFRCAEERQKRLSPRARRDGRGGSRSSVTSKGSGTGSSSGSGAWKRTIAREQAWRPQRTYR